MMPEEFETLRAQFETAVAGLIDWANTKFFAISTTYQFAAVILALIVALIAHRSFRKLLERVVPSNLEAQRRSRVLRTLSSISLPIIWVLGLWIATAILQSSGQPYALLRLAASLINAWIVIRVATTFIPSAYWSSVFAWCAWFVAALNAVGLLRPAITLMEETAFSMGEVRLSLWTVVKGAIVTMLMIWAAFAASGVAQRRLENSSSLNPSMRVLLGKLTRFAMIVVAAAAGLSAVGIDLTAFAIFSGAVGVGVGLGMQRTVGNLIAGVSLLADRSLKPGDVIEIETSLGPTYGEVKTMGSRYVAVRTRDGTETLIPNEILIANPVTNWSFSNTHIRRRIPVGVSYDTDVELAIKLCVEAASAVDRVLTDPPPACHMIGFGESSVDLEVRVWLEDPEGGVANVASKIYLEIWRRFREHKIEIPFPQRDLHLRSAIPVVVTSGEMAE